MMMKLFGKWKKSSPEIYSHNNKPIFRNKQGLFDDIYGFADVKDLFKMAIQAERPVHLLLCGPPASAKSLFMRSLTRLERSYYAIGSSSTKSGIFDYLFEQRPRYFIIDELEKMNRKDQTSLLNLMESGMLSELKHNQQRSTQLKEEFVEIVLNVLDREEGVDKDVALIIADGVFNKLRSSNIRECVRIARLVKNDPSQVNRIIDTFAKYGMN
jgi:holliday junction DNA helicase RuvB